FPWRAILSMICLKMSVSSQVKVPSSAMPPLDGVAPFEGSVPNDPPLGLLLVLSGPSGVGKDTVWQATAPMLPSFAKATTCTTRAQRPGEEHGVHYLFVSDEEFDRMIREQELLEHATVHGNRYGVPAGPLFERINAGQDVVCVIDVQGAMKIRALFPTCLLVFLRPPKGREEEVLKSRMKNRAPVSDEELSRRIETAYQELAQSQLYDYEIVNEELPHTADQLRDIVLREKKKWVRTH
ncbi:MAG: guanylate kinase, partial [Abditibacteriota bacterium]|nr:guanylate kinase [Abditibacteriota bacterium]